MIIMLLHFSLKILLHFFLLFTIVSFTQELQPLIDSCVVGDCEKFMNMQFKRTDGCTGHVDFFVAKLDEANPAKWRLLVQLSVQNYDVISHLLDPYIDREKIEKNGFKGYLISMPWTGNTISFLQRLTELCSSRYDDKIYRIIDYLNDKLGYVALRIGNLDDTEGDVAICLKNILNRKFDISFDKNKAGKFEEDYGKFFKKNMCSVALFYMIFGYFFKKEHKEILDGYRQKEMASTFTIPCEPFIQQSHNSDVQMLINCNAFLMCEMKDFYNSHPKYNIKVKMTRQYLLLNEQIVDLLSKFDTQNFPNKDQIVSKYTVVMYLFCESMKHKQEGCMNRNIDEKLAEFFLEFCKKYEKLHDNLEQKPPTLEQLKFFFEDRIKAWGLDELPRAKKRSPITTLPEVFAQIVTKVSKQVTWPVIAVEVPKQSKQCYEPVLFSAAKKEIPSEKIIVEVQELVDLLDDSKPLVEVPVEKSVVILNPPKCEKVILSNVGEIEQVQEPVSDKVEPIPDKTIIEAQKSLPNELTPVVTENIKMPTKSESTIPINTPIIRSNSPTSWVKKGVLVGVLSIGFGMLYCWQKRHGLKYKGLALCFDSRTL